MFDHVLSIRPIQVLVAGYGKDPLHKVLRHGDIGLGQVLVGGVVWHQYGVVDAGLDSLGGQVFPQLVPAFRDDALVVVYVAVSLCFHRATDHPGEGLRVERGISPPSFYLVRQIIHIYQHHGGLNGINLAV